MSVFSHFLPKMGVKVFILKKTVTAVALVF